MYLPAYSLVLTGNSSICKIAIVIYLLFFLFQGLEDKTLELYDQKIWSPTPGPHQGQLLRNINRKLHGGRCTCLDKINKCLWSKQNTLPRAHIDEAMSQVSCHHFPVFQKGIIAEEHIFINFLDFLYKKTFKGVVL